MKKKNHLLLLKLGGAEKVCIWVRDSVFNGSWHKMLAHIRTRGSEEQKHDIPIIKRLMAYEKKYGVNLNDMQEEDKEEIVKNIDRKKKKLSEVILGICQLSDLSPRDVKNVLEVLLFFIDKQLKGKTKS